MSVPHPDLKGLSEIFSQLGKIIQPTLTDEPEIDYWDVEVGEDEQPIESENFEIRAVRESDSDVEEFDAFVDGAQRIVHVGNLVLKDKLFIVPVYIGQIGVAVLERNNKKLSPIKELTLRRTVIALPVEGISDVSTDPRILNCTKVLSSSDERLIQDFEVAENPLEALNLGQKHGRIIVCDITYPGLDKNVREDIRRASLESERELPLKRTPLMGEKLSALSVIRTRAHSRINVMRQLIEMVALTEFRLRYSTSKWVLVDGPLFLLGKWFKKHPMLRTMEEAEREEIVLFNTVGFVKQLRRVPPKSLPNYSIIHNLRVGQRTTITLLRKVTSSLGDESYYYDQPHYTFYMRFRQPPWLPIPHYIGLIRLDLYRNTLCIERTPNRPSLPKEAQEKADQIANMVWRESWPLPTDRSRLYNEPFPIEETERYIRGGFYSTRELRCLRLLRASSLEHFL